MPTGVYPRKSFKSLEERFWGKVDKKDGCWLWIGAKTSTGYGEISEGRDIRLAHRVSYEWTKGKIPEGLELDHLCRNHACVNPDHLEAVMHRENCQRGLVGQNCRSWVLGGLRERAKTHCPQGHPYDKTNTYIGVSGWRHCRICQRISNKKYYRAQAPKMKVK